MDAASVLRASLQSQDLSDISLLSLPHFEARLQEVKEEKVCGLESGSSWQACCTQCLFSQPSYAIHCRHSWHRVLGIGAGSDPADMLSAVKSANALSAGGRGGGGEDSTAHIQLLPAGKLGITLSVSPSEASLFIDIGLAQKRTQPAAAGRNRDPLPGAAFAMGQLA